MKDYKRRDLHASHTLVTREREREKKQRENNKKIGKNALPPFSFSSFSCASVLGVPGHMFPNNVWQQGSPALVHLYRSNVGFWSDLLKVMLP